MKIILESGRNLEALNTALHDRWIDVDRLEFTGTRVTIPITRESSSLAHENDFVQVLELNPVQSVRIEDSEKIGYYDINRLEFQAEEKKVVVVCNIPLLLEFQLAALPGTIAIRDQNEVSVISAVTSTTRETPPLARRMGVLTIEDHPQYPLRVTFSDGETVVVEDEVDAVRNLEWLDTEDPEDPVTVVDRLGRPVRLRMEFLEIKEFALKSPPDSP